ncbi:pantoate--beta-alanine ligase [Radiobacillus kanasensis]|uniref:pantoate--beta-alanine ligase n=1 Tax=Radiobacillus kanasensis TaxID=2844358 RepID=UPI001E5D7070|nr:pantoate--beta-alanine ligase [Radiobacillus kanasensis]UFU01282.1 pantoate--beta-alanine ligase [Radiobacillus kanasensis]
MDVVRSIQALNEQVKAYKQQGKAIGFVPTMGFLHDGHQRLMKKAREQNDIVIVSIFVNPLQFGPNEDYDRYPRDEERDKKVAESENVNLLFLPTVEDMYPNDSSINLQVVSRNEVLCGKRRPGHFDGVVTVLTKLFHLTQPTRCYFGLKDAQQVAVVDSLIHDFNFPIEIVPVSTVREADGLAKSSRNVYLSEQERAEAPSLYQSLEAGRKLVIDGERNPVTIVKGVERFIQSHTHGKIDYVELLSYPDLKPVDYIDGQVILAIAVFFEHARLIDNVIFQREGSKTDVTLGG